jgi:hypothetical protein
MPPGRTFFSFFGRINYIREFNSVVVVVVVAKGMLMLFFPLQGEISKKCLNTKPSECCVHYTHQSSYVVWQDASINREQTHTHTQRNAGSRFLFPSYRLVYRRDRRPSCQRRLHIWVGQSPRPTRRIG